MKPKHLLLILLTFPSFALYGQEVTVSGTVKDATNLPIAFANVYLLSITDTTLVKGASANEDGFFSIDNIVPATYFIRGSYIGKFSHMIPVDITQDVKIGSLIIAVDAEALDEVVVTGKRPTIQRQADRVVFNVENTVVSEGNSWEILKNTPGVISMQNNFLIRNQRATIYLNNRKVQLSSSEIKDLLEGLSGVAIKSIEVIPNPPAHYEAEGGPILNIITTKSIAPGYKGSVMANYTQAVFPKYAFGTSHYYKSDKLNFFGNYTINPRKEFRRMITL